MSLVTQHLRTTAGHAKQRAEAEDKYLPIMKTTHDTAAPRPLPVTHGTGREQRPSCHEDYT